MVYSTHIRTLEIELKPTPALLRTEVCKLLLQGECLSTACFNCDVRPNKRASEVHAGQSLVDLITAGIKPKRADSLVHSDDVRRDPNSVRQQYCEVAVVRIVERVGLEVARGIEPGRAQCPHAS